VADDRELLRIIRALHLQARQAYGAYKTWKVLKAQGIACGRHRVARLRRQNGIEALRKRRFRIMTEHHKLAPPAPNLLKQNFTALQPNRVWAGDMTLVATGTGWLHLAVLLDEHGYVRGSALAGMVLDRRWEQPGEPDDRIRLVRDANDATSGS